MPAGWFPIRFVIPIVIDFNYWYEYELIYFHCKHQAPSSDTKDGENDFSFVWFVDDE